MAARLHYLLNDIIKEKGEEEGVKYYDSMELLEISITPLPSNPNAVKRASEEEKIELITYILNEALGDKFNEKLTIKGITSILRGEEKEPDKDVKFPNRLKLVNKLFNIKQNGTSIIEEKV